MVVYEITHGRISSDGPSQVKLTGLLNGRKVLINNCNLIVSPPMMSRPSPCLIGNLVLNKDIFYYRMVYVIHVGDGKWKMIVNRNLDF